MAATFMLHKSITTRWDEAGMIARIRFWIETTFGGSFFAMLILLAFIVAIAL